MKMSGVIACPEPLAAEAGAEILRNGGNAADAAIATALAQGVASPLMCGIGGGGSLVYHDARSGQATHISALGYAPSKATPTMWAEKYAGRNGSTWQLTDKANLIGYQAQLVPDDGWVESTQTVIWVSLGCYAVSFLTVFLLPMRAREASFH